MSRPPAPLRFLPIWILLTAFVVGCSKDSNPMGPGPNPQTNQGTLYVAQATGHDDNPGTEEAPFATITAALDAAAITSEI
ncbi:MAG TPA: hypothetical protein VKA04_11300, partial [Pseudodesulfovibrio sp.]|nr:hypothetical protein [Pseudodesulfovibrio sp.]